MQVTNSEKMAILLEVLGFRKNDYLPVGDKFELQFTLQELAHALLSTDEDIQNIFGKSEEWQELFNLIKVIAGV